MSAAPSEKYLNPGARALIFRPKHRWELWIGPSFRANISILVAHDYFLNDCNFFFIFYNRIDFKKII